MCRFYGQGRLPYCHYCVGYKLGEHHIMVYLVPVEPCCKGRNTKYLVDVVRATEAREKEI